MATVVSILRDCHRLRSLIRDLQNEIERGPRVLKIQQNNLALAQQQHKDHHDSITKLKLKQREDEGALKQAEVQLAKYETQLNSAGNPKEYAAKEVEIAHAKGKKEGFEDAILATMTEIEARIGQIPAVEKKWAEAQAEFANLQVEAKERMERIQRELRESEEKLVAVELSIPDKIRPTYDHLTKAYGPDAMSPIRERVCLSCRSSMTEQKLNELKAGLYVACQTCGKMLFMQE